MSRTTEKNDHDVPVVNNATQQAEHDHDTPVNADQRFE
jgi:hypothetical protein